ncbi:hypothetical protein OROGR_024626 [Orobanche gracilis]
METAAAVCLELDGGSNGGRLEVSLRWLQQIRIETDPADRTQLRVTIASGDPTLTYELKEFIKEQLVSLPISSRAPTPPIMHMPLQARPTSPPSAITDPGAILAGLL